MRQAWNTDHRVSHSKRFVGILSLPVVCLVVSTTAVAAPPPRLDHSKILIHHLLAVPDVSAPPSLALSDVDFLEQYPAFTLASVAKNMIQPVRATAAANHVFVSVHDEYDLLSLPTRTVDAREGLMLGPDDEPAPEYPKGKYGLYALGFIGPVKPEWMRTIGSMGGYGVEPFPVNGLLLALTPSMAAEVKKLPFVQFLEIYHPFLKPAMVNRKAEEPVEVLVDIGECPGTEETIEVVKAIMGEVREQRDPYTFYLRGWLDVKFLPRLLANRLVIGVHAVTTLSSSDERQVMSLTSNVTLSGGNLIPQYPTTYASWLNSACAVCGNLAAEGFYIGIADTGVDSGPYGTRHQDLGPSNSRVQYGGVFLDPLVSGECPPGSVCELPGVCEHCDGLFHGTMVAGVAAGNAATGRRDLSNENGGFFLGTGVAPSAGILSTKIINAAGYLPTTYDIFDWAHDATSRGVFVQNHSHNEYRANPSATGLYTQKSRDYDVAVRDSNGLGGGSSHITVTVSAGNRSQDDGAQDLLPPATAKNVIAMGAAENVRHPTEWKHCDTEIGPLVREANSFANIMVDSKHGTSVQGGGEGWNTYIKPDLYAPASQIVSLWGIDVPEPPAGPTQCRLYGTLTEYFINSGTSFAAPVGAAAALLASRVYAAALGGAPSPAAASPALVKAILVASARSMRFLTSEGSLVGGLDKATAGGPQIAARPNDVQGFGRISLVDVVSTSPARQYVDESPTRTFTASGQTSWSATYPVSDPSKPVKVVLAWSDAPAPVNEENPVTLLQNDLDLIVNRGHSTNCTRYVGNNLTASSQHPDEWEESILYPCTGNLDTKNNVEVAIFFPSGPTDQFTVTVNARNIKASVIPDTSCPNNPESDCYDQDFALFVYNAGAAISLAAPTNLVATATSETTVDITWSPVLGAAEYQVLRRTTGNYDVVGTTPGNSFTDSTAAPSTAYLYTVRALDPSANPGSDASPDLATTIIFADDPIIPAGTTIKAAHVTTLRSAVNAIRLLAGLDNATFTDQSLSGAPVKAIHVQELRTGLDTARAGLALSGLTYTDPNLTGAIVKARHVQELRTGVK